MSDRQYQYIEVSFWTMLKAALLVILLWAIWLLRDVVAVILLSIVIASAIEPLNHWFKRYRVPRVLGVIVIYLGGFLFFMAIIYLMIPRTMGVAVTQINILVITSFATMLGTGSVAVFNLANNPAVSVVMWARLVPRLLKIEKRNIGFDTG